MSGSRKKRVPNQRLIALRINAGLSPNQLADLIDVSAPTIRLAEKGFLPEPRVQYEIASYFEVEPLDLWPMKRQLERVGGPR